MLRITARYLIGFTLALNGIALLICESSNAVASVATCGGVPEPSATPEGSWACCVDVQWYDTGTQKCCEDPECSSCGQVYDIDSESCCCEGTVYTDEEEMEE
jgi:hypothetical protein